MYDQVTSLVRSFFQSYGLVEISAQDKLSILAACEDPRTIATFSYAGQVWPLPQTGQMHLEIALLKEPEASGFFCMTTSYRNEPNPVPGRHDLIFPMAEFELPGDITVLEAFERELMIYLGLGQGQSGDYGDIADFYDVYELDHEHEKLMQRDFGDVFFLKNFPIYTSPFWNMKNDGQIASKIDVIVKGVETIGSAERSCNPDEMRHMFNTISGGMYRDILYANFTKERVEQELGEFLALDFFPRCGGGIGLKRLIKAMS